MPADEAPTTDASRPADTAPPHYEPGVLKRVLRLSGSDAVKYFPVRFVPALTSFVTLPLFTRLIGATDYGRFYLVSSASTLAANVATGWISSSNVRFYWPAKRDGRIDDYTATSVWTTFIMLFAAGLIMAALTYAFRGSLDPAVVQLLPVGLAYFFFNVSTNVMLQIMRAANRANAFSALSIATTILVTGFDIAFVLLGWGSFGLLAGVALGNAIVFPFVIHYVRQEGRIAPSHVKGDLFKEFLHYGLPLVPVGMSTWILVLSDRYVIEWARGATEVGLYSVSYSLGDRITQLITIPLLMTMSPMLIQTFEHQGQAIAVRLQTQFTRYFTMVSLPLLAGLAAIAPLFVQVFVGQQYRSSWPILAIVSAASVLGGFAQIAGTGLGLHKKSRVIMENTLAAAAFNIGANIVLVPRFGYMVAAYTTVAAYGVLLVMTWLRSRPYMRWKIPGLSILRVAAASAIMVAAVLALRLLGLDALPTLVLQTLTGIVVYAVALVATRELRRDELAFARDAVNAGLRKLRLVRADS